MKPVAAPKDASKAKNAKEVQNGAKEDVQMQDACEAPATKTPVVTVKAEGTGRGLEGGRERGGKSWRDDEAGVDHEAEKERRMAEVVQQRKDQQKLLRQQQRAEGGAPRGKEARLAGGCLLFRAHRVVLGGCSHRLVTCEMRVSSEMGVAARVALCRMSSIGGKLRAH